MRRQRNRTGQVLSRQRELAHHHVDAGCDGVGRPVERLDDGAKKLLYHAYGRETVDITCRNAFTILAHYNDDWGKKYKAGELEVRSILNKRNDSILAHGTVPLDIQGYQAAYEVFTRYFEIAGTVRFARIDQSALEPVGLYAI